MKSQMIIRGPEDLRQKLRKAAKSQGYTLNSLVLQILWEWVKHNAS